MTGVEEKGLAFYDPVSEMQAGNNNSLAEYVFTIQQQLFSVIQAGSKIVGEAAGLSALEVSKSSWRCHKDCFGKWYSFDSR